MIHLDQPSVSVRRMLRLLRRPHLLEREALALRLRKELQAASCRDAILQLIDQTFSISADGRYLRDVVVLCDVDGHKARAAAASMHLSLRQFYRRRAEAIEALAMRIECLDELSHAEQVQNKPVYCAMCYQRIIGEGKSITRA